jgi:hypothetical protein
MYIEIEIAVDLVLYAEYYKVRLRIKMNILYKTIPDSMH